MARFSRTIASNCCQTTRVFDEERYFTAGREPAVFNLNGIRIGLNICEDIWSAGPIGANRSAGAECVLVINGSPFEVRSQENRENEVRRRVAEIGIPVVYVNHVGGQDELVFDGGSFVMDAAGEIAYRAQSFEESMDTIVLEGAAEGVARRSARSPGPMTRSQGSTRRWCWEHATT